MAIKQSKSNLKEVQSRRDYRKLRKRTDQTISASAHTRRQQRLKRKEERKRFKKPKRRIFPIWLRIIIVLICCVVALAGGLMVGFGIIGNGHPTDALKIETWQHIIDFVIKD